MEKSLTFSFFFLGLFLPLDLKLSGNDAVYYYQMMSSEVSDETIYKDSEQRARAHGSHSNSVLSLRRVRPADESIQEIPSRLPPASEGPLNGIDLKESVMAGALRGITRIPLEHPFDVVKTVHQSNPDYPSARAIFISLYRRNGFGEFYRGAVPSALRSLVKESYRWGLNAVLQHSRSNCYLFVCKVEACQDHLSLT